MNCSWLCQRFARFQQCRARYHATVTTSIVVCSCRIDSNNFIHSKSKQQEMHGQISPAALHARCVWNGRTNHLSWSSSFITESARTRTFFVHTWPQRTSIRINGQQTVLARVRLGRTRGFRYTQVLAMHSCARWRSRRPVHVHCSFPNCTRCHHAVRAHAWSEPPHESFSVLYIEVVRVRKLGVVSENLI
jgi:hypothetical protein